MRVKRKFFERGSEEVARDLLGKVLVRRFNNGHEIRGVITETEAYVGEHDLASHARFGKTKRNEVMYGSAGIVYMFFVYGVHWMLNFVTSKEGDPQAVLIRGLDIVNGPARLCKLLELDSQFYGEDLETSQRVWVEDGKRIRLEDIASGPRVGVDYAKDWKNKPLRFILKGNND